MDFMKTRFKIYRIILVTTLVYLGYSMWHGSRKLFDDIHPNLAPYLQDFSITVGIEIPAGITVGFYYNPKEPRVLGYCNHLSYEIAINERAWSDMDNVSRRALMYHELAHCVMGVRHFVLSDTFWGQLDIFFGGHEYHIDIRGCPSSLMSPYIPFPSCIERHWEHYVEQLRALKGDGA